MIAYALIGAMLVAAVAAVMYVRRNSHSARTDRDRKRDKIRYRARDRK
jgi:hypothetical protein